MSKCNWSKNYILALKKASRLLSTTCKYKSRHGAGLAGTKIAQELDAKVYMIRCFVDDDLPLQKRSTDCKKEVFSKIELPKIFSSKFELFGYSIARIS